MIQKHLRHGGRTFWRWFRWLLLAVLVLLLALGGWVAGNGYLLYHEAMQSRSMEDRVADVRAAADYVTLDELPALYPKAVVAVEDRRFYLHNGVDPVSILRAVMVDLQTHSLAEGGSTITQQLAKKLCFTRDKSFVRKAAEVFAAWKLESICTKDEILELYINTIYYGSDCTGLNAAAQWYFGCPAAFLSPTQCTVLVGLPKAPSAYSPEANVLLTLQRQRQVLAALVDTGVITQPLADWLESEAPHALARWLPAA